MITDRRMLLAGLALLGASSTALAETKMKGEAAGVSAADKSGFDGVLTAKEYYENVLGPAELSLSTSQLAVEMAATRDVLEFGGFELAEAITVNMVLKDLGTTSPAMSADAKAAVEKMKAAGKGPAFDRAYIGFQLANHLFLRDLADGYLHNSIGASDPAEKQGRSLAALMLGVFKEHVAICKRISTEINA